MIEDERPDIHVIWQRKRTARRNYICSHCNGTIEIGSRYESVGLIQDGEFVYDKLHEFAYLYPSGCPRFRHKDIAEIEGDFS
jgi:hypothetical protein